MAGGRPTVVELAGPHDQRRRKAARAPVSGRTRAPGGSSPTSARHDSVTAGTFAPGAADRPPLTPASVLELQRSAGNAAVAEMLDSAGDPRRSAGGGPPRTVQRAISGEQADRIARQLDNAMEGWGTDEEAIYGALSGRSKADIERIRTAYLPFADEGSLDADLRDELTDGEMARVTRIIDAAVDEEAGTPEETAARRAGRAKSVAQQLDEAMRDLGTEEDQIYNVLTGRTPHEMVGIAREYRTLTGRGLEADLRDEMSGTELEQALGLYRVMYTEGDGPQVEIGKLQRALNATGATPPVRVTAMFDAATTTALRAFQAAHPPLASDGQATLETWLKLDELAPTSFAQGLEVVTAPTAPEPRGVPKGGTIHPTISGGSKGAAVEELQQKLLTIPVALVPTRPTVNGKFDKNTRKALIEFQKAQTPPMAGSGIADAATWAALDAAAGPVTVGREDFAWDERVEGTVYTGDTHFTWRLAPDRLDVTVNIRFTGGSKDPMVTQWRNDITNVWNRFKFVDEEDPARKVDLRFIVGSAAPPDATVKVTVTPPGKTPGRSNAGEWHTGDKDPGLAPHEFGHLIGFQDEYNRAPEMYGLVTGELADVGKVDAPTDAGGVPVSPDRIAKEIRTAATSTPAKKRGGKTWGVAQGYGLNQGAFAERVAIEYETLYKGKMLREDLGPSGYKAVNDPNGTIANDLAARIPDDSDDGEAWVTDVFLHTNRSIMGSMRSLTSPVGKHDHPIAPRHVRHFLNILARNRPGKWKVTE